jgi:hypothetical protein
MLRMVEAARYRALERVELQPAGAWRPRVVMAGEEFDFEGKSGSALLALNAAARGEKLKWIEPRHYARGSINPQRIARGLGFEGHDATSARNFIRDFVTAETGKQNAQRRK